MALTTGVCLSIFIGTTNNHGVIRSTIQRSATATVPVKADLIAECNALFTGELVKLSYQRAVLPEAEKITALIVNPARYSRFSVNGTARGADVTNPIGFRLEGLGAWVGPTEVRDFIIEHCKLPDGGAITKVFVNAFREMA